MALHELRGVLPTFLPDENYLPMIEKAGAEMVSAVSGGLTVICFVVRCRSVGGLKMQRLRGGRGLVCVKFPMRLASHRVSPVSSGQ